MDPNEQNNPNQYNEYAYQGNTWQPPQTQPPEQPPKKHGRGRVIAMIAIFLAGGIVFSALTGIGVYTFMKMSDQTGIPQQTTQETNAGQTQETTSPSTGSTNKNFSLPDAATRQDGNALSVMGIAAKGKPAVVAINTQVSMQDMFGQISNYAAAGSGFIISQDGYIVTNNHVISGAKTITVVLDNEEVYDAKLVGTDAKNDIAVLKIEAKNLPTVTLGTSADLEVGELAVAIGNPLGELSGTVTAGIISALDRSITLDGQTMHLLQTDAAINSGNSGGALFNSFGEVIGINTAKNSGSGVEGLGFAIPIDRAKPIIESLVKNGYVQGRPKIGITTRDITAQMAEYYNMTEGIFVYEVEAKSAAAEAGIQKEDIIIAANGKETLTTSALSDVKDEFKPGDTLELTIIRNSKQIKVKVVLKEEVPTETTPAASGIIDGHTV